MRLTQLHITNFRNLEYIELIPVQGVNLIVGDNAYNRSVIAELMKDIDLGVIPSLWWETYNQVGYEMIMHGVPVLISDTVGIKDFFDNKELFLFKSGDKDDFSKKIVPLVINKEQLSAFWRQSLDLPSMETHTSHIIKIYQNLISNVL